MHDKDAFTMNQPYPPPPGGQYPAQGYPPPQSPQDAKARARAEKAYRKASRPFYKKKRFIIPAALVVLLVIIIATSHGGSGTATTPSAASASSGPCAAPYPDKQANDVCADGKGTVTLNGMAVTATPFANTRDDLGTNALCSTVAIKNSSGKSQDYNVFDFKVQTPGGDVATTGTASLAGTLNSGTLVAGGTKTGKVCSDNTGEKGQYVFIYKPNPFESTRGIWLFTP